MPQPFLNAVLTNGGANLLTRSQAGEIKIEFTRIATGNGDYTEEEKDISSLQKKEALKSLMNSFALSSVEIFSEHSVKVKALITNQDPITKEILIDKGYYINEMGLYAKVKDGADDTEVLYSIAVTAGKNGDFMPPYNGYNPVQIIQSYISTVSNSKEVTIQTKESAAALAEDLQEARDMLEGIVRNGAVKSLSQTATLLAEAWEGEEAPYTYTLPVEGATDTNNIEVLPAVPLTQEQYEAMSGACITGAGQAEGSITLDAWGDKPEIDLPIIVIVRGD